MADEKLRMTAEVVDQFSEPLRKLKGLLNDINKDRDTHFRTQRAQDEQLDATMTRLTRNLKDGVRPALSLMGIELGGVGAAIAGVVAKGAGFAGTVRSLDQLSRQTQTSTTHLREIGAVAELLGMNFDQATQGFKTFTGEMTYFRAGLGNAYRFVQQNPFLQPIITDLQHARTDFEAFQRLITDVTKMKIPPSLKREILGAFGLPEEWASLEGDIRDALDKAGKHIVAFSKNSVENAKQFSEAWRDTKLIFDNIGNAIGASALPQLNKFLGTLDKVMTDFGAYKQMWESPPFEKWFGETPLGREIEKNAPGAAGRGFMAPQSGPEQPGGLDPWRGRGTLPRPMEQQGLPSHAFGTNWVTRTGFALLHEGERVTPGGRRDEDEKKTIKEGTQAGVIAGMQQAMRDWASQSTGGGMGGGMQYASYHPSGGAGGGSYLPGVGGPSGGSRPAPMTATPPSIGAGKAFGDLPPWFIGKVKGFEGFTSRAKWDYHQYSYGYGTRAPGAGATITRDQAEVELMHELGKAEDAVNKLNPSLDSTTKAALTDLVFNAGPGALRRIAPAIKSGDRNAIASWLEHGAVRTAGGRFNAVLDRRRRQEADWIKHGGLLDAARGSQLMGGGAAANDITGKARLDINIRGLPKGSRTWMDGQGSLFDNTFINTGKTGVYASPQ